jgi:phosphatidylserine/phosphatidylglycerophosphate/cardiolipin synthase-like enzyme
MDDWKRILKTMPGARILVAPGINERIHAKTFVFDGIITIIGSYNMDPLSEDINSEVVAAVHDKPFATQQRLRILGKDTKKHVEYRIELDDKGNIIKSHGPESHVDPKTIKKLNFLRKLQWLRPII